jgi:transposase InsO family protein
LNNGIRHLLTAPYSPTTTGKVERLHKTMRKEFFSDKTFGTIDDMQQALDTRVAGYNNEREHQSLGDVPPVRRFAFSRACIADSRANGGHGPSWSVSSSAGIDDVAGIVLI